MGTLYNAVVAEHKAREEALRGCEDRRSLVLGGLAVSVLHGVVAGTGVACVMIYDVFF